jgi:hypothetical protein
MAIFPFTVPTKSNAETFGDIITNKWAILTNNTLRLAGGNVFKA